jgi:hypothetical protein
MTPVWRTTAWQYRELCAALLIDFVYEAIEPSDEVAVVAQVEGLTMSRGMVWNTGLADQRIIAR